MIGEAGAHLLPPPQSSDVAWLLLALGVVLTIGIGGLFVWILRRGGDDDP